MSASFSVNRDQIIKAAMQECQALSRGQVPLTEDITDCSLRLNAMLKEWDTKGVPAWCYQRINFPSVIAKVSYTIGETAADVINVRPIRVTNAWTQDVNNLVQPLVVIPRAEFIMQTPTNAPGPSTTAYYDPQLGKGVFYPWPIPIDTARTFYLDIIRPISDINSSGDTFDIPQEGYLSIMFGLAELIMGIYGTETNEQRRITNMAQRYSTAFFDFAEEDGSTTFIPDSRMG